MTTWAGVGKGDAVLLKGKRYVITKHKRDGKRITVTVVGGAGKFTSVVKAKAEVELAPAETKPRERWATKGEAKRALGKHREQPSTPPAPPSDDPWTTRRDRVEERLDKLLGAHLVGEATDEAAGYYVPPVDVSTVAAHMALFHGTPTDEYGVSDLLELHVNEHLEAAFAESPRVFPINHWHTETRPEPAA